MRVGIRLPACLFYFFALIALCGFSFRINDDLGSLDWGHGEVTPIIVQQLMEGLTVSGKDGRPLSGLASRWSSPSRNVVVFELRPGAIWSDGEPVCARHFVDAWRRVLSPKLASPYAHYLFDVKNARAIQSGKLSDPTQLGARSLGCKKLEVTLEHPAAYFPALASHWVLAPVRLDLIRKYGQDWMTPGKLAVTGPYVLEKWNHDKEIILRRNPRYYGDRPFEEELKALVIGDDSMALTLFRAGKLDWLRDLPFLDKPALSKSPEYSVFPSYVEYHLGFRFGPKAKPESKLDRGARCALAMALDKQEIPQVLKGDETPADTLVPHGLVPAGATAQRFDPVAARKLWQDSSLGSNAIEVYYYAKDIHGPLLEWAQGQWKKHLGADIRLIRMEAKSYWSRLQQSPPEIFLSGITAAYAHPYIFLSEFLSDSRANWGRFSSKEYDSAALLVAASPDGGKARTAIGLAQNVLLERECAVVPLYFRKTPSLLARGWTGLHVNPMTYTYLKTVRRDSASGRTRSVE